MSLPQYTSLSVEASYRFDERLAILGVYGEPTLSQYRLAFGEAAEFDAETVRRRVAKLGVINPLKSESAA